MPSCRSCNHYKRANDLEGFRAAIETIPDKLERDNYIYKVGVRFGNVIPAKKRIVFTLKRRNNETLGNYE